MKKPQVNPHTQKRWGNEFGFEDDMFSKKEEQNLGGGQE